MSVRKKTVLQQRLWGGGGGGAWTPESLLVPFLHSLPMDLRMSEDVA